MVFDLIHHWMNQYFWMNRLNEWPNDSLKKRDSHLSSKILSGNSRTRHFECNIHLYFIVCKLCTSWLHLCFLNMWQMLTFPIWMHHHEAAVFLLSLYHLLIRKQLFICRRLLTHPPVSLDGHNLAKLSLSPICINILQLHFLSLGF